MTQARLAERLKEHGVELDRAAVAKIEVGLRGILDYEVVGFAKILRKSVSAILGHR